MYKLTTKSEWRSSILTEEQKKARNDWFDKMRTEALNKEEAKT